MLDECQTFKNDNERIKRDERDFFEKVKVFKQDFNKELNNTQIQLNATVQEMRSIVGTNDNIVKLNSTNLGNHRLELKRQDIMCETMKRTIEELYEQIKELIQKKLDKNIFHDKFAIVHKDISHFKYSIEDNNQNVQSLDSYLDKYLPFRM
jgi:hypothetical protein